VRGFVISRLAADEAEILTIAVDAAFRRYGVGGALLRGHCARVAAAGAKSLFLEVDPENAAALALYRRLGFVEVGQRKGYYRRPDGQSATALVLKATLPQ